MIGIVNYGSGNIKAISNIYNRLGIEHTIISSTDDFDTVQKIILPGVGSFDDTMNQLIDSGLKVKLDHEILINKKPLLGICVGMQLLANESEEGKFPGLGYIAGQVKLFEKHNLESNQYLPHMGWNNVKPKFNHELFNGVEEDLGFYFVHSYYFEPINESNILATTTYAKDFVSAVISENIFGVQFHPEKSHSNGIQFLKNFANYSTC